MLNRLYSEFTLLCLWWRREPLVEIGVVLERQTVLFVLETAEDPKNI